MSVAPQQFSFSRITRELTVTGSGKNLVVNKKQKKKRIILYVEGTVSCSFWRGNGEENVKEFEFHIRGHYKN